MDGRCCTPGTGGHGAGGRVASFPAPGSAPPPTVVSLPGGSFSMGDESDWAYAADGEGPVHEVRVGPFRIDRYAVSNEQFVAFIQATGYRTDAERYGWSFVFAGQLPDDFPDTRAVVAAPWWRQVFGADWAHPEGHHSSVDDRMTHPVVHVSWNDAQAYCAWSATRLPTEAEWEYAARAGTTTPFPWGDDIEPDGSHRMNVFQGRFPSYDTGADGYVGTAPVDAFPPNDYGLHNVTGNVWEWCNDWYDPTYYERGVSQDPSGPETGTERVLRGGSYLCHFSYCRRYRVGARHSSAPDSSAANVGFRVAADSGAVAVT